MLMSKKSTERSVDVKEADWGSHTPSSFPKTHVDASGNRVAATGIQFINSCKVGTKDCIYGFGISLSNITEQSIKDVLRLAKQIMGSGYCGYAKPQPNTTLYCIVKGVDCEKLLDNYVSFINKIVPVVLRGVNISVDMQKEFCRHLKVVLPDEIKDKALFYDNTHNKFHVLEKEKTEKEPKTRLLTIEVTRISFAENKCFSR